MEKIRKYAMCYSNGNSLSWMSLQWDPENTDPWAFLPLQFVHVLFMPPVLIFGLWSPNTSLDSFCLQAHRPLTSLILWSCNFH